MPFGPSGAWFHVREIPFIRERTAPGAYYGRNVTVADLGAPWIRRVVGFFTTV